ncbi:hypothetical protein QYE76_007800 [Lolium multiflorum]|uniref:Arabidopsis retrotransposon Orf1 C-terminal domain-containing protein n=1 Tax=Lolium multiflorum TaxID=4521 RepID=A0AAD8PLY9_LOLMU|nr:hypothetical protein QYE76_007800 [Lolium multiflorum]
MGKPRDTKVTILPSTTRKGTTLSTSAALDSPSVISQLVSPPQTSRVGISAESENSSDNFDDASTVLDNTGSLGPFLDATIARSRQIENTETPNENTVTPVNSPEIDDLDEDYVELDDDFIDKCNATTSTSNLKKLIAQHAVRYKLSPDPKFATSPINIKDKDYDFSLDLSHISIVEKTPFCGTEKESAVEHMNELSTLSSLFSDDVKMRTYFVAKIFPFSLKDDAKIWKRTPDEAEELLAKISKNHDDWSTPEPTPTPILKKRGMIELNDEDMREAKKSLMEKGIKSEDVKNLPPIEDLCKIIPPSSTIEYMKDIVSNKRKIPNEEISTMLANYSFNGKVPKKLGDPDKLIPTDISLQMADKSTAIPVGVCENVPVQVTQHCLILTDFVVLEMPEDDNMSIILGRPFLNTAGAVIDCNKGKVTFNVDDKEHTVYFPKRIDKVYGVNTIFNVKTIKVGSIDCPIYEPKEEYQTLVIGSISIQYKDFEFHRSQTNPMVRYKIYNKTINLPFSDFCAAIRVPQWGSCEKVRGTPRELSNLYTMICHGRSFSDDGGKISSIQLPAIRYFAYFVTKCVLARKNASKLSVQDMAFLAAALQQDRTYNLGALIACRLATNHEKGGICGGLIASRLLAMHGVEPHHLDIPLSMEKLDVVSMIKHEFISDASNLNNLYYRITLYKKNWRITKKIEKLVRLPAPALLNLDARKGWSITENELNAYIEREGHHARDGTEEAEEHLDSSSDAASSSYQHYGHVEPPRHSSAQGPYYHSMYDPPAWNPDPRWE